MITPYVTPTDLLGNPTAPPSINAASDAATLGVGFQTISEHRLWELCSIATGRCDAFCGMTLRATSLYEENSAPSHRVGQMGDYTTRFITSRKPIMAVVAGQWAFGGPPWTWNPIPLNQLAPQQPVMDDFGSGAWNGATSGMAAILIGNTGGLWNQGRNNTRIGLTYLAGWPHTGLVASAEQTVTLDDTVFTVTVSSATGIHPNAPVTGNGIPLNTTVSTVVGTTVTLSAKPTTNGSSVLFFGYPAGTSTFNVDDVTAWGLNIYGWLYDGQNTEPIQSSSVVADTSGLVTPAGPGTITLATATLNAHLPGVAISALPQNIRWAAMLHVKCQVLERGESALVAGSVPNRSGSTNRQRLGANLGEAERLLLPYRRTY